MMAALAAAIAAVVMATGATARTVAAPGNTSPPAVQVVRRSANTHCLERHMDRFTDRLCLPVAALREFDLVCRHRLGRIADLQGNRGGRRQDAAGGRHRLKRGRQLHRELKPDRCRRRDRRTGEHGPANYHGRCRGW